MRGNTVFVGVCVILLHLPFYNFFFFFFFFEVGAGLIG